MTHTPGPWTIYHDHSPIIMARKEDENYDIATLPDEYLGQDEIQANARLIAAAPDLLKALEDLLEELHRNRKMNVKKDYSLLVADSIARGAIHRAKYGG